VNKSKNPIKGLKKSNKKQFTISPIVWIVAGTILGLALIIGILFDQLYKSPLVTIDGKKYYLEDLTYQFYNSESTYNYINQLYGGSYWDMPYNESTDMTVRDFAKVETINNIIYEEILYNEAVTNGYTLTQEEIDKIDENVNSALTGDGFSEELIKKNGFTAEYLKGIFSKNTLASRYKQDIIDTFDIDDKAIEAEINYDDYRQYDIEYLFISTQKTNEEDYSKIPLDKIAKEAALDKITSLRLKALDTEDWSAIIPEDEEELQYRTSNVLTNDTYFSEDLKSAIFDIENGDITDVIEDEDGYYVIRMINNNSPDSYNKAVDDAITKKEEEAFTAEYTDNIFPKHTFKLNNNAINNLRMGRITLVD
jgi:foldase protein PrsA